MNPRPDWRGRCGRMLALGLSALAVVGCSTPGPADDAGAKPTGPAATQVETTPPAESPSGDPWLTVDPSDPMSIRNAYLEEFAATFLVDQEVPDVEFVRFVPVDEQPPVLAECLTQEGFPSTVTADGGVRTEGSGAQDSARRLALYVCYAKYPPDPQYMLPLSPDQLGVIYDYYVETLVPCLTGQGFAMDAAPSRETWIEEMHALHARADGGGTWTPYISVIMGGIGQSDLEAIQAQCPDLPPDELIYGQ